MEHGNTWVPSSGFLLFQPDFCMVQDMFSLANTQTRLSSFDSDIVPRSNCENKRNCRALRRETSSNECEG